MPDSFMEYVSLLPQIFMVFGGSVAYVPQYKEIQSTGNVDGFSLYVCLTLLVANILRICFWFGHRFELPLLFQSIVMIITMFVMIHVWTKVKSRIDPFNMSGRTKITDEKENLDKNPSNTKEDQSTTETISVTKQHKFTDLKFAHFWQWSDFGSYVLCTSIFSLLMALITAVFIQSSFFVETIGFLAVISEALLGAPQFYQNWKQGSTYGMSLGMVLIWTVGDVFKTGYFILRHSPLQFWVCGILQCSIDLAILLQVALYRR